MGPADTTLRQASRQPAEPVGKRASSAAAHETLNTDERDTKDRSGRREWTFEHEYTCSRKPTKKVPDGGRCGAEDGSGGLKK